MKTHLRLVIALVAVLLTGGLSNATAQTVQTVKSQPDCIQYIWFTAAGSNTQIDNRQTGCQGWVLNYNSYGFSALTIAVQSAPAATATTPGSFVTFAGTTVSGTNPGVTLTQATWIGTGYYPWMRINVSGLTGTGTISGVLYGWRNAANALTSSGGGGSSAVQYNNGQANASPIVVNAMAGSDGTNTRVLSTTAGGSLNVVCTSGCSGGGTQYTNGQAVATPTLTASGLYDGANVRAALSDTTGRQYVQGPLAVGSAASGARPMLLGGQNEISGNVANVLLDTNNRLATAPTILNGSGTAQYQYSATLNAYLNMPAGAATITQLVGLTASQSIRIASVVAGLGAANTATFSIVYGTGTNCGTGTTTLVSFGNSPVGVSYPVQGWLVVPVSNAVCIQSGATTTTGWDIGVIYAKF